MNSNMILEEMKYRGWAETGIQIPSQTVEWLKQEVYDGLDRMRSTHGEETLDRWQHLDIVKCLFSFTPEWKEFISSKWLNDLVDLLLHDKAVIYDVFGLMNIDKSIARHTRGEFHRDQLYLGNLRASILVVIPLVDFTPDIGPTEVVTGTHLIEEKPSKDFLEKHTTQLLGKAGNVFVVNASTWHRGGGSPENKPRPAIIIRYQLPFLKRTIDLCEVYREELEVETSELVKLRLGWYAREANCVGDLFSDTLKFTKGNYNTEGLYER